MADTLAGGGDTIHDKTARDRLVGGIGDDLLYGGKGSDTFVFASGGGQDTIADFDQLKHHIEDTDKGALITADDGSTILIKGVRVEDLGRDAFVF